MTPEPCCLTITSQYMCMILSLARHMSFSPEAKVVILPKVYTATAWMFFLTVAGLVYPSSWDSKILKRIKWHQFVFVLEQFHAIRSYIPTSETRWTWMARLHQLELWPSVFSRDSCFGAWSWEPSLHFSWYVQNGNFTEVLWWRLISFTETVVFVVLAVPSG